MARRKNHRRRRFEVEGLESRQLLTLAYQFAPFTSGPAPITITPTSVATGPARDVYVTVSASVASPAEIGDLNPTTHALTLYPTPTQGVDLRSLIDVNGDFYFAEYNPTRFTSALAVFNPTTRAITEFPLAIQGAAIGGITLGQDGNIYFTDQANSAIGKFVVNDPNHPVTETPLPATGKFPTAIATAPNGLIVYGFGYPGASPANVGLGTYNPTTGAFVQVSPTFTGSAGLPATATSFAVGGNGLVYFSAVADSVSGSTIQFYDSVGSFNPAIPLTTSNLSFAASTLGNVVTVLPIANPSFNVAAEPDGNIAYTTPNAVGVYNVTTGAASTTTLPDNLYPASDPLAVAPSGTIYFSTTGAVGIATTIPATEGTIVGTVLNDPYGTNNPIYGPRAGQLVELMPESPGVGVLATAVANANGTYVFNGVAPGTYLLAVAPFPGGTVYSPHGGGSIAVTVVGGQVTTVSSSFGVGQNSVLLPLTINLAPFGSPPDQATAEATAYYNIILGRAPDAAGLANAVAYLKAGGSLEGLALWLLDSAEYETKVVSGFFTAFLGRTGSAADVSIWVAAMQKYGLSEEQVAADFLNSPEFNAGHPDNTSFVQALFEGVLGRQGSAADVSIWTSALSVGVSRAAVIQSFIDSPESLNIPLEIAVQLFNAWDIDTTPYVTAIRSGQATLAEEVAALASLPQFVARANGAIVMQPA